MRCCLLVPSPRSTEIEPRYQFQPVLWAGPCYGNAAFIGRVGVKLSALIVVLTILNTRKRHVNMKRSLNKITSGRQKKVHSSVDLFLSEVYKVVDERTRGDENIKCFFCFRHACTPPIPFIGERPWSEVIDLFSPPLPSTRLKIWYCIADWMMTIGTLAPCRRLSSEELFLPLFDGSMSEHTIERFERKIHKPVES